MKKVISIFLAAAIVLALMPVGAIKASANYNFGHTDDYYYYATDSGTPHAEIYQFKSRYGSATVPSTLWGQPVTMISAPGFRNCYGVTSVTLPNTLTQITTYAFSNCVGLTSITIPDSVTTISTGAFDGCKNLTSVHMPTGLTGLNSYTFRDTGLTEIYIPAGVTTISITAFLRCYSLAAINVDPNNPNFSSDNGVLYNKAKTTLLCCPAGKTGAYSIPSGVTTINKDAFLDCSKLTSLTIPSTVTTINAAAFTNNSSLTAIIVDSGNANYSNYLSDSSDGILFNKTKTTVCRYPQGKSGSSYDIPSGVTTIQSQAFDGCAGLSSINFTAPVKVTAIGTYAFRRCSGLTSISIPAGVTTIQNYAFHGCVGLTSVTIPANATTINEGAFYGCTGLTSVNIPSKVATVGNMVFQACSAMTSITVDSANTKFLNDTNGVLFNLAKTTLVQFPCGKSGEYAVPSTVTTIAKYAFQFCSNVTSISVPSGVTSIGTGTPGENGFIGYDGATVMFSGCSSLTAINVSGDNITYSSNDGVLFNKSQTVIYKCPGGKSGTYTIPNGVITLDSSAFMNCANLTSVSIPNSVTTINKNVFQNCTGLTSITIPSSVTTINDYAFNSCKNLKSIYFLGSAPFMGASYYRFFDDCASDMLIYYPSDKYSMNDTSNFYGFTNPWYGASTVAYPTEVAVTKLQDTIKVNIKGWVSDYKYQIWSYQKITSDFLLDANTPVAANQWILSQAYTPGSTGNLQSDGSINFMIDSFTSPDSNYTIAVRIIDNNNKFVKEIRDSYTPAEVAEVKITKVLVDGEYSKGSEIKEIKTGSNILFKVIGNGVAGTTYTASILENSTVLTPNANEFTWDTSAMTPGKYTVEVKATNGTTSDSRKISVQLYALDEEIQYGNISSLGLTAVTNNILPKTVGINPDFTNGSFYYKISEPGRTSIFISGLFYTPDNIEYNFTKYGVYYVQGYVNRAYDVIIGDNFDDGYIKTIEIKRSQTEQSSETLTANVNLNNPISKSTEIHFVSDAKIGGIGSTPVQYSFWRYDANGFILVKDWSSSNTLDWTPARVGVYTIQARARGADAGSYEVCKSVQVNVTDSVDQIAQGVSISINDEELNANARARAPIFIKASATTDDLNKGLLYKFYVSDSAMGTYQLQNYSANQDCVWTPRKPGTYTISVLVKNEVSFGKFDAKQSFSVVVAS